ncbi:CopD family protein [Phenylobacterium sp.]|uniref:CopD family protein n=1 Tax=Phenylobacterium sp. TaxID=1871053 RepID=UPI002E34A605|nr:CopD family protein [Phenylobacterium sp.]HEX2560010.1 CopD family protein [Phenylobacterium sp.]
MSDWIAANYDLLRGVHILAVIAWMVGIMYLPRLFAYHTNAAPGSELDVTFQAMEGKLMRIIMNPAMVVAWILGLTLLWHRYNLAGHEVFTQPWLIAKLAGVVFVTGWHHYLAGARKAFARGENKKSNKFWRATNELPFLAAIVMVIAVTTEFGR